MFESFLSHFPQQVVDMIGVGILETIYMVIASSLISYIIGLPLGMLLVLTDKKGMKPIGWINGPLNVIVNILRSIPFLILMVALQPVTRAILGTSIGTTAATFVLIVTATPFVARMVEQSLQEVDSGVIEAAQSMGASLGIILWRVMLPEARPPLVVGATITVTTILGYSAMAGFLGGGGLGDIALRYGYQRFETEIMIVVIVLIVLLVQIMQEVGMRAAKKGDKRNRGS